MTKSENKKLTVKELREVVQASWKTYKKTWWRIGALNSLMALCIILGTIILSAFGMFFFRGELENIILNISNNTLPTISLPIIVLGIGWILFVGVFIILGKISNWILLKNSEKQTHQNILKVYFVETWKFFGRYVILGLRAFWPIIFIPISILLGNFLSTLLPNSLQGTFANIWSATIFWLLFFLAIIFVFYRMIRYFFLMPCLIKKNETAGKIFTHVKTHTQGNFWRLTVVIVVLFTLFINLSQMMSKLVEIQNSLIGSILAESANWLVSLFLLTPLFLSFQYDLFLRMEKLKKTK